MRNLKKILAMVLALVMSLSLMATAGAANFTDASSINEKYETAIEVLEGLGVFKGYDENGSYSFKPTGEITRAETAAIIYRIVTGDVTDSQVGIYADYNLFTDVPSTSWYAGYVNFCANAEYIKGVGGGKFDPSSRVTGYAALAMILRAIGYTANGGFTGPDWEVQTARTAEARKITKNIMTGTLGQPATRETVAEILFQAILVNMVDHNVLNTLNGNQGYTEIDETLGYKTFKLEQIEGIVMGNEYADLNSEQVLADGQTQLQVAGEENLRNLAITTKITDIGESRYAYITGSKVLAMGDTGNNKVTEFGHACDISTTAKFNAVAEMPAASDIEYFVNFDPWTADGYDCDQRLEFSVILYGIPAENAFDSYKGINISRIAAADRRYSVEVLIPDGSGNDVWCTVVNPAIFDTNDDYVSGDYANATQYIDQAGSTVNVPGGAYTYPVRYTKIIWAGQTITDTDLAVLESIFGMADNDQNNVLPANRITGDVYVGTKSTTTDTDEERDLSNTISYKKFFEDYINDRTREQNWETSFNGDWVKFIDNDGDGACEYAFWTGSFLDEAIHTYTNRNGDTVTEFNAFDDNTYDVPNGRYTVRYLDNDGNDTDEVPAVGDKVVAAYIDNQYLVEPALDETVTVSEYSWRNDEITTDKGTYGQSGIGNATDMQELISNMDDKVEYVVYFDHFGYVRAYELPGGTQYALVTELYYTNMQQGNLVQDWPMTVELWNGEEGKAEYNAASGAGTFRANYPWLLVDNLASTANYNNWLQPAIEHLGVSRDNMGAVKNRTNIFAAGSYSTVWPANLQVVKNLSTWSDGDEFNYGVQNYGDINSVVGSEVPTKPVNGWTVSQTYGTASFTNVAVVNISGNDAYLSGAAQLSLNNRGEIRSWNDQDDDGVYDPGTAERVRYAVDYIQLDRTADVVEDAVRYPIGGDATYKTNNNYYVNAVHDTEFYIVFNGGVYYFKDFVNMPALDSDDIHAAYAVARDTSADNNDLPYWVADVIVYEMYNWDDELQTSVSLAYYTPTRLSGTVQQVETLNNKYGPMVTLTPGNRAWNASAGQWGAQWEGYGFYALYNDTEPVDNVMTARDISRIGAPKNDGTFEMDYNKNRIYAGIVTREAYIAGSGWYIDVAMAVDGNGEPTGNIASIEITDKIYSVTTQAAQSDNWYGYNEANLLRYQNLNNSQVKAGDYVIWVNDGAVKASATTSTGNLNATKFVVDLGNTTWYTGVYAGADLMTDTPNWLIGLNRNIQGGIIYDAQGKPVVLATASTSTSEWQKIMWEQCNWTAPVEYKNNITVIDNGDATKEIFKTGSDGTTLDISEESLEKPGFTLTNLNKKDSSGVWQPITPTYTDADSYRHWVLEGLDGDLVLSATYTAIPSSLTLTNTAGVSATGMSYKIADNNAVVDTVPAAVSATWGNTFEISFPVVAGETYTAAVTSSAGTGTIDDGYGKVENGRFVIKGTINGNLVIELTKSAATDVTNVSVTANSDMTLTFTSAGAGGATLPPAGGLVSNNDDVTFTVEPATGYEIVKVEYEIVGSGDPAAAITPDADVYTITSDKLNGLDVKITVTTASTTGIPVTFSGDADPFTGFKMSKDGNTWMTLGNTTVQPSSGVLWINTGATGIPTPTATVGTVEPTPAGSHTIFKVTGITADTVITINSAAAIGAGSLSGQDIDSTDGSVTTPTGSGTVKWVMVTADPTDAVAAVNDVNNTVAEVEAAIGGTLGTTAITLTAADAGKWIVWADVDDGKVVGIVAAEVVLDAPTDNVISISIDDVTTGAVTVSGTNVAANVFYKIVDVADIAAVEAKIDKWNILTTKAEISADLGGGLTANNTTAVPAQTTADIGKLIVVVELDGTGDTDKVVTYKTFEVPDTVTYAGP